MTKQQLQEYWDYCLIHFWREFGMLSDACARFKAITGMWPEEAEILRTPVAGTKFKQQLRPWVHKHLPKLDAKLHATDRSKDAETLKNLTASSYQATQKTFIRDHEQERLRSSTRRNKVKVELNTTHAANRNRKTDWDVTK